jgi:signal transduction histidine kinase
MLDRNWLISSSCYFFFKQEYESVLEIDNSAEVPEFEKVLKCSQFLKNHVIPLLKEKEQYSAFNKTVDINRAYLETEDAQYLVSFNKLYFPELNKTCLAGIYWNLDSIRFGIIPNLLEKLEKETNLEFQLADNKNINLLTGEPVNIPEESLKLSFNNIPFPWKLVAIQPGYKKLESDAKREVIIYGLLVVIIIALMVFAVFALMREITRETNSMLLQTEFVHNVSHELKTPLSLIRLYGETLLLKENLPKKDQKEGLQIITKESERLSHMINNILDFSKIEMGRKEFDLKPGNLKEVIENTLDSYRYHLLKKGFKITEELESNIPKVLFDISAVEGILINLLSNAVKFSGNTKQVAVRLKMLKENIILEVADKGIGIPEKELKNIFNRFYRVKGNSQFEARGSGLGLTLVKHAVQAHDWKITVKSKVKEGTTFTIFIPFNPKKEEK